MNKTPIQVEIARPAAKDLKQLSKKYPHVVDDIMDLIDQLAAGDTPGDQIPGVGYTVYKVRIKSSDLSKGKSSGYRAIYYVRLSTNVILITVYIKNERVDISPEEIRRLIEEYEQK
jgi:mRNA-degrading endonuclease RelE of RelBE toxin-antitoxin system